MMSKLVNTRQRIQRTALASVLLLLALVVGLGLPLVQFAGPQVERLANGSFEDGFSVTPFGSVGAAWHWFHSGGAADYHFFQDGWEPVVTNGGSSQLISISTVGWARSEADRYAGIYQTVAVEPGERYQFSLKGMLRAGEDDPDRAGYNYRVQYGIDYEGASDWRMVPEWVELPWDAVHPRLEPGQMESYSVPVEATTKRMTIFIRVWKKWGTTGRDVMANLDAVSLRGAMPRDANRPGETYSVVRVGESSVSVVENTTVTDAEKLSVAVDPPEFPVANRQTVVTVMGANDVGVTILSLYDDGRLVDRASYSVGMLSVTENFVWTPKRDGLHTLKAVAADIMNAEAIQEVDVQVGRRGQFLANGSFDEGFRATPAGMVGQGWGWFHNAGRVNVGFYDDTWTAVVDSGGHSQLIELSSVGWSESDPDRYAGIYQTVAGLKPGADYTLTVQGMLRARAEDPDREGYNYQVEWGIDAEGGSDWHAVTSWSVIPWHQVYERESPGAMNQFRTTFKAPSSKVTVYLRVWKKWGTVDRELDVNLDSITLAGYQ